MINTLVCVKQVPDSDLGVMCVQAATMFVVDTLMHAKKNKHLKDWIAVRLLVLFAPVLTALSKQLLQALYDRSLPGCYWFVKRLTSDAAWLTQMLLACQNAETRLVRALLSFVCLQLRWCSQSACASADRLGRLSLGRIRARLGLCQQDESPPAPGQSADRRFGWRRRQERSEERLGLGAECTVADGNNAS